MIDLAILLPDRPGALAELGEALGRAGVSIEGGGAFVVGTHGVAHFLFEDGNAARQALEATGITVLAVDVSKAMARDDEAILASHDAAGIHKTLITGFDEACTAESTFVSNESVAAIAGRHPDRFLPFAGIDILRGAEGVRELERWIRERGFRGLSLRPFMIGLPADAVLTEGSVLHALKNANLLVKFDAPERKAFEARFKDKDGFWTDVYPTVHSIPYNTKLVAQKDLPRRYTDLLDPKWKGKLGANRNNCMVIAAMIDLYGKEKGEDFIRKLAQQEPQVRSGGTLTATLVGAGEMPLAFMVYANNVENVKESGSPVDWVRVEEPLYAESHPIAIMAKAPHPNAARLLAEFAISKEGQQLISNLGKMPGRSDVQPKIGVNREKLRMIPPEHEAKTAHYQKWFDDLFGKGS